MIDTQEETLQTLQTKSKLRELVNAYAHCADTKDAKGQALLFTKNTRFLVFMDPRSIEPSQTVLGRASLVAVFEELKKYGATQHFNGQSTFTITDEKVTGITYCHAHHQLLGDKQGQMMIAAIRYLDTFEKDGEQWLFAERKLMVDWIENR